MLKSLKNKIRLIGVSLGAVAFLSGAAFSDGSIGKITILGLSSGDTFTAGTATNTVSNDIIFNILTSTNGIPDAGQTVSFSLVKDGSVVANGMSQPTLTTTGSGTLFGGDTRPALTFYHAGTVALRVTSSNGVSTDSDSFTVVAGTGTKLVLVGPGQTIDQGKNPSATDEDGTTEDGVSGSFLAQEPNQSFTVTVYLTDNQFNRVNGTHNISFPGPVPDVTLPSSGNLDSNGRGDFEFTITGSNATRTITAQDNTDAGVSNGTLSVTTVGPPAQEVFPFPSPFNPKTGNITFRFRITEAKGVTLIVTDIFGQKVWETSVSGSAGINDVSWNGRNDKGEVVAAGVYYVLFETGGSIESKRRFGVVK